MSTSSGSRVRREGTIATSSKEYARRARLARPISISVTGRVSHRVRPVENLLHCPPSRQVRDTACAMLELPDHLAPLLRPEPHLDVLGTSDPWPVPDGWLEATQQRLKVLAEGPRGRGGEA